MKKFVFFAIILLFIALTGCNKPYSALDEKGKIKRTFMNYIGLLDKKEYEKSFDLLYFGHIPKGGNIKMYIQAQKIMDNMCSKIEYQASEPIVSGNLAVMDLAMIMHYRGKGDRRVKKLIQVFFVKSGGKWKIVMGQYQIRMKVLKVYPEFAKNFNLHRDKTFIWENNKWKEIVQNKKESTKISNHTSEVESN